jgi:hypothetical protein
LDFQNKSVFLGFKDVNVFCFAKAQTSWSLCQSLKFGGELPNLKVWVSLPKLKAWG